MPKFQESDQVMVEQDNTWFTARPAVVVAVNDEWADVMFTDTKEVEQVHVNRMEHV